MTKTDIQLKRDIEEELVPALAESGVECDTGNHEENPK